MGRFRAFAIVVVLLAVAPAQLLPSARAQSISITTANSPFMTQAYGTGKYDTNGNVLVGVIVTAYDGCGNLVASGNASTNNGTWAGVVLGLKSGQTYSIGGTMTYTNSCLQMVMVSVPAANRINVKVQ